VWRRHKCDRRDEWKRGIETRERMREKDRKIIRGREKRVREREIEKQCEEERGKRRGTNVIYWGERKRR
jgi:hypothetical protein